MYGKALFWVVLVVVGAVLPYILADDAWLSKLEGLVGGNNQEIVEPNEASEMHVSKPNGGKVTTAGKVVESTYEKAYRAVFPSAGAVAPAVETQSTKAAGEPTKTRLAGLKIQPPTNGGNIPLTHLLSFDVTQAWIRSNWRRISTRVGEFDLQGWRVPYSRQSQTDDFAGSITYYFDRARHVQRIVLHGYTSDPAELEQLATTHYQMRRIPDLVNNIFVALVDRQPLGGLYCRYASLLNSKDVSEQCEVTMELNRQRTEYGMSYEFEQILDRSKKANALLTPIGSERLPPGV